MDVADPRLQKQMRHTQYTGSSIVAHVSTVCTEGIDRRVLRLGSMRSGAGKRLAHYKSTLVHYFVALLSSSKWGLPTVLIAEHSAQSDIV